MRPLFNKILKFWLVLIAFCFLTCACERGKFPEGVIATVNGEPIFLHTLQTVLDTRSSAFGMDSQPSFETMRQNYANVLGTLVLHTLVRQELAARRIDPDQHTYHKLRGEISTDYDGKEKDFLADAFIREDDWEQLMRDSALMELFRKKILLPDIVISRKEISDYYNEHKEAFSLPEMYRLCFVEAETEAELKKICKAFSTDQRGYQCSSMPFANIPQDWQQDIKNMGAPACASYRHEQGVWQTVAYAGKKPGGQANIVEVYALIENLLKEKKEQAALNEWLAKKISESTIQVVPELNDCLTLAAGEVD